MPSLRTLPIGLGNALQPVSRSVVPSLGFITKLNDLLIRHWAHCQGLTVMERALAPAEDTQGSFGDTSQSRVIVR